MNRANNQSSNSNSLMSWITFIILACVEFVLLAKVVKGETSVEIILAVIFIAILILIAPRIYDLISITVSKDQLSLQLNQVQQDLNQAKQELEENKEKIDRLFLMSLSPPMYHNLYKISRGYFGDYEMNEGLKRELYHLRDIGYIEVKAIKSIPNQGSNLSEYVKITATGQEYVNLRETILKKT